MTDPKVSPVDPPCATGVKSEVVLRRVYEQNRWRGLRIKNLVNK